MTENTDSHHPDEISQVTIIPAQPGWYLARIWGQLQKKEPDDWLVSEDPIVAWRVETRFDVCSMTGLREFWSEVVPIATDCSLIEEHAIVTPDGTCNWGGDVFFDCVDDWFAQMQKHGRLDLARAEEKKKKRKKKVKEAKA